MSATAACALALGTLGHTPVTIAAVPVEQVGNRGASMPFTEYEAENACHTGTLLGPSREFSTLPSEASGRRAVRLDSPGQYVEFALAKPANALTLRYAIPDSADGGGRRSTLGVYVDGSRIGSLSLSSEYGWFYGDYPFTNRPADGKPHRFYDEARLMLGRTLPAGTRVRLQVGQGDDAPWYAVDLADFELVPPPAQRPANAMSIRQFGADPTGTKDSYRAIRAAIAAARRRGVPVWIDPGRYRVDRHLLVDGVTVIGAGPWYSVLTGNGVGLYGRKAPNGSTAVTLRDFAIIGEVRDRVDEAQLAGIGGAIGGGSTIANLWLQHHKVGIWLDGPLDGLTISGLRIVDNAADGINLRRGARNAVVEQTFVRNSGDDGIALWSHREADRDNAIRRSTVIAPSLANGIAVYGGRDIVIADNLVADSVTQGGGIHLGNRFDAEPLSGSFRIENNLLVRSGSFDPNWRFGVGALWFYALDHPIDARIEAIGNRIVDSTITAVQFIGKPIRHVRLGETRIDGAHHWLQVQSAGAATLFALQAANLARESYARCDDGFDAHFVGEAAALAASTEALCGELDPAIVEERLRR